MLLFPAQSGREVLPLTPAQFSTSGVKDAAPSVALNSLTAASSSWFLYRKDGDAAGEPGEVVDDDGVEEFFGRPGVGDHPLESGPVVRGPAISFVFVLPGNSEALFIREPANPFELRHDGLLAVWGKPGVGRCHVLAHISLLDQFLLV